MMRPTSIMTGLCLAALLVSGCGDDGFVDKAAIAAAKSAVKKKLANPESAEFGNVWLSRQDWGPLLICGYVSAQDRISGQGTGFQRFVYAGSIEDTRLEEEYEDRFQFDETWEEFC